MDIPGEKVARLRNLSTLRQSRQIYFLRAAIVGIFAAAFAIAFQCSIDGAAAFVRSISALSNSPILNSCLLVLFCGTAGLVGGCLTQFYAPEAGGSGIPHVKAVLLHLRDLRFSRLLPVKFLAGALAIGSGFSLGREGPTVHIGAAVADGIGKFLKVPSRSRSHLIACGAGAGLAAAFNAPLAGFLFVIEELRRELSPITYGAAFIAAVIADGVVRAVLGPMSSLSLSIYSAPALTALPTIIVIALVSGGAGILFNRTLIFGVAQVSPRLSLWKRGVMVGLFIGIVSLIAPYAKLGLQGTIDQFLQLKSSTAIAMWTFGGYFALKYFLTIVSYLSGLPGGIFAPMLAQGALLGVFTGRLCGSLAMFPTMPDGVYGILGMAAFFAASVRAPLTGVVLIAEMTDNFDLLFLLLVSSLVSYLLAELVRSKPIYEALMELELRKTSEISDDEHEPLLIDVVVEPHSRMDGSAVRDMKLQRGCLLITVRKHGKEVVPYGETIIHEGDELTFLVDRNADTQVVELRNAAAARPAAPEVRTS